MGELAIKTEDEGRPFHPLVRTLAGQIQHRGDHLLISEQAKHEFLRSLGRLQMQERRAATVDLLIFAQRIYKRLGNAGRSICEAAIEMVCDVVDDLRQAIALFEDETTDIVHISDLRLKKPAAPDVHAEPKL